MQEVGRAKPGQGRSLMAQRPLIIYEEEVQPDGTRKKKKEQFYELTMELLKEQVAAGLVPQWRHPRGMTNNPHLGEAWDDCKRIIDELRADRVATEVPVFDVANNEIVMTEPEFLQRYPGNKIIFTDLTQYLDKKRQ